MLSVLRPDCGVFNFAGFCTYNDATFLLSLKLKDLSSMYQRDYILRMIEMLGDLIAAIMGSIKKVDYKQASEKSGR
jgi:hypothetical protein